MPPNPQDPPARHPHHSDSAPPVAAGRRARISALDVIRGFALCGILLANVKPIANAGDVVLQLAPDDSPDWPGLFIDQRFFPIFSFLFGVGFSLLVDSAATRTTHPRRILLRRLLALLAIGLVHRFLLWEGDILTIYAVVGLLVLLPSTWLPRRAVAVLAAVLLIAPLLFSSGGVILVPGLFLLGSALTRYGVIARIEQSTRVPALLCLALVAGAVPAVWFQIQMQSADVIGRGFSLSLAVAGLLLAGAYVCGLLLLLRTRLRPALQAVFAPLGRMALTNYLSATLLVLATARLFGPPEGWHQTTVWVIAAAILAAQWLFSTLWLGRCRFGPVEWLWRWATWAERPPLLNSSKAVFK
ncbi:DUF418 domain-containing protein [Nonomuraea zeae]|uniref:DUF418 domain-containing protein n=1 Tax=Nonomuraea zeae TaxID=1642303 RepID=A0A5S4GVK4_9ACTN|nr:DUF418 domain-containing protein [Nonomuraea zeae]TMR36484.1 DUF418 domain-containing protein [Nonomuraea zeae]